MLEISEHPPTALPLVLCHSRGGPYDDESFLSGWRLGSIGATLARPGISALAESIRPHERHQTDLIAMACGYTMTVEPTSSADWLSVTFTRTQEDRSPPRRARSADR
jgi:hypothetical protein